MHKEFTTPTSPVLQSDGTTRAPLRYRDVLDSTYRSDGGAFRWAVNPSTRPYVDGRIGREPTGPTQAEIVLPNPAGIPAVHTGDPLSGPHESVPFTVQPDARVDNARMDVTVRWGSTGTDWDLYVLNGAGEVVSSSAQGGTSFETAVMLDPPAGRYRAVLVNYAGGRSDDWRAGTVEFQGPRPAMDGRTEAWLLTCERPNGAVAAVRRVTVARGKTARLGDVCEVKQQG